MLAQIITLFHQIQLSQHQLSRVDLKVVVEEGGVGGGLGALVVDGDGEQDVRLIGEQESVRGEEDGVGQSCNRYWTEHDSLRNRPVPRLQDCLRGQDRLIYSRVLQGSMHTDTLNIILSA
mgnify:CR=1 FL=1